MPKPTASARKDGKARLRCAIYTRKSSEEGLEQEFNSLDAQREACSAFITSQKHEGWQELPTYYDDGGFSGGTMERPALQRLLADIAAHKVDVVVVYKVDRLTRALSDFARIVETFDKHTVSFVSVTQQFNTTSSMGRLTLNVLLSFAQFEREVTGERIRDKIAASKAKGIWMGGFVSLGYDVNDRKLVINERETETVRHIFRRYLQLGSVRLLKGELDRAGVRSKVRTAPDGSSFGHKPLARGALYLLLQNPIYRGQIKHRDKIHPGEHEAIIDLELWDKVQGLLKENRVEHKLQPNAMAPSLLTGILFDSDAARLTPTHAIKKNGTRYRYYVSSPLITDGAKEAKGQRIPAEGLETLVTKRLADWLSEPETALGIVGSLQSSGQSPTRLVENARRLARDIASVSVSERRELIAAIVPRIQVHSDRIEITLSRPGLISRLGGPCASHTPSEPDADDTIQLTIPVRLRRAGLEMRLVVDDEPTPTEISEPLVRLLVRAHGVRDRLFGDAALTIQDIARQEGVGAPYVTRLLRLAFLGPSITAAVLSGAQPPELTARRLMDDTRLPLDWADQHKALGID